MRLLDILKKPDSTQAMAEEANISALEASGKYTIKLRNGNLVGNIPGPLGLKVGTSVTALAYPGRTRRYVIVGESYRNVKTAMEVSV